MRVAVILNLIDGPTIVFRVMEGYEVLNDRFKLIKDLLRWKEIWLEKRDGKAI